MSVDAHTAVTRYRSLPPTLPPPVVEQWDWQLRGSCRTEDPSTFYPPADTRGRTLATIEARAKAICLGCAVLQECRDYAIEAAEPHGIWGATTSKERALAVIPGGSPLASAPTPNIARVRRIGPPRRTYIPVTRRSRPNPAAPLHAD